MKKKLTKYNPTFLLTLASLFLFFLFLLFLPSQNIIFKSEAHEFPNQIKKLNFTLPSPALLPQKIASASSLPDVTAESYLVLDFKSNIVLFSKNKNKRLKIASITKLMTALVAKDIYADNQILTAKTDFSDGVTIGLAKGDKFKFQDALKALLIPSANDAAQLLADNSKHNFVSLMNKKAKILHLDNTFFTNPQGFDDGASYSTAFDLARLGNYALRFNDIKEIVNKKTDIIDNFDKSKTFNLTNVNQLLFTNSSVHGIKTGNTDQAGECLMSLFEENGHKLIIVVLKSDDRFGNTEILAKYAFSNFIWQEPLKQTL